jgi:hypothetical protein
MVHAYITDNNLIPKKVYPDYKIAHNDLYNKVVNIVEDVKYSNPDFYSELFDLSRDEQYRLTYSILDENYVEEGIGIAVLSMFLGSIATKILNSMYFSKIANKVVSAAFEKINNTAKYVYDLVTKNKFSETYNLAYKVINNRAVACSQKCGIHAEGDLDKSVYNAFKFEESTDEGKKQAKCLLNCYIDYNLGLINILKKQYTTCLNEINIHNFNVLDNTGLHKHPMEGKCSVYSSPLADYYDNILKLIKYIEKHDPELALIYSSKLKSVLSSDKYLSYDKNKNTSYGDKNKNNN